MLTDRPIRMTENGLVESYDRLNDVWSLDWSRDPREYVPLSIPPLEHSTGVDVIAFVNSIIHSLRADANLQGGADAHTDPEPYGLNTTASAGWPVTYRANFDAYANFEFTYFWVAIANQMATQWFKFDLSGLVASDTFWTKMLCHLYCAMEIDGTFTREKFSNLLVSVRDDTGLGDYGEWAFFQLALYGRKALTNLAYVLLYSPLLVEDPSTTCTGC